MTNPDTDPLDDVEAYLLAGSGLWSVVVPSLRESILENTDFDGKWPEAIRDAIQASRRSDYDKTIRLFAKRYAALNR